MGIALMMDAVIPSETLVAFCQTTRHSIPEDCHYRQERNTKIGSRCHKNALPLLPQQSFEMLERQEQIESVPCSEAWTYRRRRALVAARRLVPPTVAGAGLGWRGPPGCRSRSRRSPQQRKSRTHGTMDPRASVSLLSPSAAERHTLYRVCHLKCNSNYNTISKLWRRPYKRQTRFSLSFC
jgi:hypothetical protein